MRKALRKASHDHIAFVRAALQEVERADSWQEVADLRLKHRRLTPEATPTASGRSKAKKSPATKG